MANLQIKGIDQDLYDGLKRLAVQENRSVSQQMVHLIKERLRRVEEALPRTPASALLNLAGSWEDERGAEEIAADLRAARRNSTRKVDL